jgi:hypothetical protein
MDVVYATMDKQPKQNLKLHNTQVLNLQNIIGLTLGLGGRGLQFSISPRPWQCL